MSSIITKRGDKGVTDCLYNQKAAKSSLLIEAIGSIDELNASIGLSEKLEEYNPIARNLIPIIQENLVALMGELSAQPQNFERYQKDFGKIITFSDVKEIEQAVHEIEKGRNLSNWAKANTYWDQSCRICRRAERTLWRYSEINFAYNTIHFRKPPFETGEVRVEVHQYINRLSDFLWILGRK